MTPTIQAVEQRLHDLANDTTTQAREQCYQATISQALPDLLTLLNHASEEDVTFLRQGDFTIADEQTAENLDHIKAVINQQFAIVYAEHLAAKKVWSQAMNRVYQVQASEKATEKQIQVALDAEQKARLPFDQTFARFMDVRRAEEASRNIPYAYQEQTLSAVLWAALNIVRVHSYTPGAGNPSENLLRNLP